MIIIRNLYLFIHFYFSLIYLFIYLFFVQQFKAGHLSIAFEIPTRHKCKLQYPTKHTVCVVGVGIRNVINCLFVCFLIDNGEIIHACSKAFV